MKSFLLSLSFAFLVFVTWPNQSIAQTKLWNNGSGALVDVTTGLMWQEKMPSPASNGFVNADYCEKLTLSGSSDWRIPSLKEWFSLVDFSRKTATVTDTHYFDIKHYPDLNRYNTYLSFSYFPDDRFPDFQFLVQFSPSSASAVRPITVDVEDLTGGNLRMVCVANLPSE